MSKTTKVLAFDAAMNGCSACVYDVNNSRAVTHSQTMLRGQAEVLVPMIQKTLEESKTDFEDIDLIGVTKGPGAFTGLRIGLSTAKSMALALDIPLAGLTTLEVIAHQCAQKADLKNTDQIVVLVETKREDFYVQIFDTAAQPISQPEALLAGEIAEKIGEKRCILTGDGVVRFQAVSKIKNMPVYEATLPDPEVMAKIALKRLKNGKKQGTEPLYLRAPDVSTPKEPPRSLRS